ncbi:hypothetical protein M4D49_27295 [Cupriavidus pauculus]|uniref:hypothetical protein n=1 Tax=Cupriavidus TaxID=106589 RepID=UPI00049369DD|nr:MULTISPECIES: hypothetical protein [Cupriavidus]MCM3609195.1 hypothetical protein [Cupriavidus pauculus]
MELAKIPQHVLGAVRQREKFSDAEIGVMTPRELFEEYCNWHGIIGWADTLWDTMQQLSSAGQEFRDQAKALASREDGSAQEGTLDPAEQQKRAAWLATLASGDRVAVQYGADPEPVTMTVRKNDGAWLRLLPSGQEDEPSNWLHACAASGATKLGGRVLPLNAAESKPKVAVWLEDGVVQGAVADKPVDVVVIEFDDLADKDERFLVPQADGSEAEAVGSAWNAKVDPGRTAEMFEAVEERRPAAGMRP